MSADKSEITSQHISTNSHQGPVDDQGAVTPQQQPTQKPENDTSGTTTVDTSSVHPKEAPRAREPQLTAAHDFIHRLPHEILYQIFEHMGFYDFATSTRVCLTWRAILMESLWPQKQEEFFSLYPLVPLTSQQRVKLVDWLKGHHRSSKRPRGALARLQNTLESADHLKYLQLSPNTGLAKGTLQVFYEIEQRVATVRELVIRSVISPYKYDDLFLRLASCRELKKLNFAHDLSPGPLENCDRQLSITYLSLNHVTSAHHVTSYTRINFLKKVLLLCPALRDLVLKPQSYWKGTIRQILQACPTSLSTFVFIPAFCPSSQNLDLAIHSLPKLSVAMDDLYVDPFDLAEAVKTIAKTLELLHLIFPYFPRSIFQPGAISSLADAFQQCYKLHTVDIQGDHIMDEALVVLSTIPKLQAVYLTLIPPHYRMDATGQGFVDFFTKTDAPLKRVGLYNCSQYIDNEVLYSLTGLFNLEFLEIAETQDVQPAYDDQYCKDIAQKIKANNPKLEIIDSKDDTQRLLYLVLKLGSYSTSAWN